MTPTSKARSAVEEALEANPGAVLEYVAKENKISVADVIECLPRDQVVTVSGDNFVSIMTEISNWGEITFLVHTDDLILEAKGVVPKGSETRGFYNLHGKPIGGHLKAENCATISFVSRPLFKNDTHSVQFYNKDGACMFKVYLGRDEERQLIPEQVKKFQTYRDQQAGQ